MLLILILLVASTIEGFSLGYFGFHWSTIAASGLVLAFAAALLLHMDGFRALPGIATIVFCLTLNQFAFLIGTVVAGGRGKSSRP